MAKKLVFASSVLLRVRRVRSIFQGLSSISSHDFLYSLQCLYPGEEYTFIITRTATTEPPGDEVQFSIQEQNSSNQAWEGTFEDREMAGGLWSLPLLLPPNEPVVKKKEIKVVWKEVEVRGQENSRGQKGYANTSAAFHNVEGTEIKGRWWMHGFCMASQLQGHRAHCLKWQNSTSWCQNNYGEGEDGISLTEKGLQEGAAQSKNPSAVLLLSRLQINK